MNGPARPMALLVAIALSIAAFAPCLAAQEFNTGRHAYCAAMGHRCPMVGADDCCAGARAEPTPFVGVKRLAYAPPMMMPSIVLAAIPYKAVASNRVGSSPVTLISTGLPEHLRTTILLI